MFPTIRKLAAVAAIVSVAGQSMAAGNEYFRNKPTPGATVGGGGTPGIGTDNVKGTGQLAVYAAQSARGRPDVLFQFPVMASNPNGSVTWSNVGNPLPAGLALTGDGVIVGNPTQPGTYGGLQVQGVDANGQAGQTQAFTILVADVPSVTLAGGTVSVAAGGPVSIQPTAARTYGSESWYLEGTLPAGLAFNASNGRITGTTDQAGTYPNLVLRVTDSDGSTGRSAPFTLAVTSAMVISGLVDTYVARANAQFPGIQPTLNGASHAVTWSLASGALPAGLTLDQGTGLISGTPTALRLASGLRLRATDNVNGASISSAPFSVNVGNAPVVSLAKTTYFARNGKTLTVQPQAAGLLGTPRWFLDGGAVPGGLSLNGATGQLTGTMSMSGTEPGLTLRVVDLYDGTTGSSPAFSVGGIGVPAIAGAASQTGVVGSPFSIAPKASNILGTATWALSGTLPAGLSFDPATGTITGTPTTATTAPSQLSLTVTDGYDGVASVPSNLAVTVQPVGTLAINGVAPSYTAFAGRPFVLSPSIAGATGSVSWQLSSLPSWVSFNTATGQVTGTPAAAETSGSLQITAQDDAGKTASSPVFTLNAVKAVGLAYGGATVTQGQAFSLVPTVSNASGTPTFSVTGTLPDGVAFSTANGTLSGTSFAAGTYPLTVTATDSRSVSDPVSLPLQVAASPWRASMPARPAGKPGTAFSTVPSASGFSGTVSWVLASGTLPSWASLSASTGAVTGMPTEVGSWGPLVLEASDAAGERARTNAFNISAVQVPVLAASAPNGNGYVNAPLTLMPTATASQGATTWSLSSGTLPAGMSLDPASGAISGTPTAAATSPNIVLMVADGTGATASTNAFSISVALSGMQVGAADGLSGSLGQRLATKGLLVTGANGSYTVSLAEGALPSWATLNPATGIISGVPSKASDIGTTTGLVLQVTDGVGYVKRTNAFSVAVYRAALAASSPSFTTHQNVSLAGQPAGAVNALGTVSWSVSPALPAGLTLNTGTGAVSGAPTGSPSAATYTLTAQDAYDGAIASTPVAVTVLGPPAVSVSSAYPARQSYAFSAQPRVSSSIGALSWTVASGSLPPGITLNGSTGALGGVPTNTGTTSGLSLAVTDAQGVSGTSATFSITVGNALALYYDDTIRGFGYGRVGVPYGSVGAPQVVGAAGAVNYALSSGTLPAGVTVNPSTGALGGTPTAAGSATVTVSGTDGSGETSPSNAFGISVGPAPVISVSDAEIRVGAPLSIGVGATNVRANDSGGGIAYAITGTLPPGISFSYKDLALTGTPAPGSVGAYPLKVSVRDADGATGSASFKLTVTPGLSITGIASSYPGRVGVALSPKVQPVVGNAKGAVSWTAASNLAGMTLDGTTGVVSGPPTTAYTGVATLYATDATDKASVAVPVNLAIAQALQVMGPAGMVVHPGMAGTAGAPGIVGQRGSSMGWSSSGTALPSWATLDGATGIVSTQSAGSTTVSGVKVRATDSLDQVTADSNPFALTVVPPPAVGGVATSYTARVGFPYATAAPNLGNAIGAVTWSLGSGTLPSWAALNADGTISGSNPTPSSGASGLTLVGTDGTGASGRSVTFAIGVYSQPAVTLASTSATGKLRVGDGYTLTPTPQGIAGTPTWAAVFSDGSMPPGLGNPDASGVVAGTLTGAGYGTFTLKVTDSADGSTGSSQPVSLVSSPALQMSAVPNYALHANGQFITTPNPTPPGLVGTPSYKLDKDVPPGMNAFNASTGVLSGQPTQGTGPVTYTQTVTDSFDGRTASTTFTVNVYGDLAFSTQPQSASVTVNQAVSVTPAVTNALGTVAYTLMNGSTDVSTGISTTCPGVTFSKTTGALTGTTSGSCSVTGLTVVAKDSTQTATSSQFGVTVSEPAVTASVATASYSVVPNAPFTTGAVTAGGGTGSYTYTLQTVSGTAPANPGAFAANGSFTFTTTAAGTWVYTIKVTSKTNASNVATTGQVTVTTAAATATINTTSLTVMEGAPAAFKATSSIPSATWTLTAAPSWMSIAADGSITSNTIDSLSTQSWGRIKAVATSPTNSSVTASTAEFSITVNASATTIGTLSATGIRTGGTVTAPVSSTIAGGMTWTGLGSATAGGTAASDVTFNGVSNGTATYTATNTTTANNTRYLQVTATTNNVPASGTGTTPFSNSGTQTLTVYPALSASMPSNQLIFPVGTATTVTPTGVGISNSSGGSWTLYYPNGGTTTDISATLGNYCAGLSFTKASGAISGTASGSCSLTGLYQTVYDAGNNVASLQGTATTSTFSLNAALVGQAYILTSTSSATFTLPKAGMKNVRVMMIGGGSSGGTYGYVGSGIGYGTGGGSGYLTYATIGTVNGNTLTYQVGAGGTMVNTGSTSGGAAGSNTTLTVDGSGIVVNGVATNGTVITANGGTAGSNGGNGGGTGSGGFQASGGVGGANGNGSGGTGQGTSSVPWSSFASLKSAVVANGGSSIRYGGRLNSGHIGGCGGAGITVTNALPSSAATGASLGGGMGSADYPCYAGTGYGAGGASGGTSYNSNKGQYFPLNPTGGVQGVIVVEWDAQ